MCGIAAVIDAPGRGNTERLLSTIDAMISVQRHRGPDAQGKYIAPDGSAALGHTRLSIIDLSRHGNQPMSDVSGRYWLVFNGEVYNYLELQQELRGSYLFRTRTDTEVVLASYLKWGPACLDRLLGMFAFIVWDKQTRTLFAARDRFDTPAADAAAHADENEGCDRDEIRQTEATTADKLIGRGPNLHPLPELALVALDARKRGVDKQIVSV